MTWRTVLEYVHRRVSEIAMSSWLHRAIIITALLVHATSCTALSHSRKFFPGYQSRRRAIIKTAVVAAASTVGTVQPAAALTPSRTDGYAVQRPDREWQYLLSGQQYFILREGGTEPPNSSPLVKEKRKGVFKCAACPTALFEANQKFDSGTGWPSYASPLEGVQNMEQDNMMGKLTTIALGSEVRCATCGGHLGDVFGDGYLFPGTPAFLTGKRYCIDGAALIFEPSDGGPVVKGEGEVRAPELPSWLQPPPVGRPVG